jgi:hypothetical protein
MRKELEKTQKSFADLKIVLDKTRSSIADFGIQKEALEGRNQELQKRLSEIEITAAGIRKEKEELQRSLSESRTSVRNTVKHDKLGGSVYVQRPDLQVSKQSDARNAHSNLGEPHRWSQERRPRDGNMNAEAGNRRELKMMERQLQGVQEFVTAMDTILGLGDAVLTEDLKTALRRDCGGQGRLLEKLMLQREELEAWRQELLRERALTTASMQDLEDVLNGLDPFAVRKCILLHLRKKGKKTKMTPTLPIVGIMVLISFSSTCKSICNTEQENTRIRGPPRLLRHLKAEHLEQVRTSRHAPLPPRAEFPHGWLK